MPTGKRIAAKHKQWSRNAQGELLFYGSSLKSFCGNLPAYVYHLPSLRQRADFYLQSIQKLSPLPCFPHYALKANSHPKILTSLRKAGLGADVVSKGELSIALKAGFRGSDIIFSGVGKTEEELRFAIQKDIAQINVESLPELERIAKIAKRRVRIGLRVNPGVNPKTHPYIATGFKENKFGIDLRQLSQAMLILNKNPKLVFAGLSLHIGSQLFDFTSIFDAIRLTRIEVEKLGKQGFPSLSLDIGGGVGVDYSKNAEVIDAKTLQKFCQASAKALRGLKVEIHLEPGRFLVARSGVLLAQVQYLKKTPYKNFIVLNSGMNHLLRPALYQAKHRVLPVLQRGGRPAVWDVVGPVCESADVLAHDLTFKGLREGDFMALSDVGAYGYSMASSYNSFPMPAQLFID